MKKKTQRRILHKGNKKVLRNCIWEAVWSLKSSDISYVFSFECYGIMKLKTSKKQMFSFCMPWRSFSFWLFSLFRLWAIQLTFFNGIKFYEILYEGSANGCKPITMISSSLYGKYEMNLHAGIPKASQRVHTKFCVGTLHTNLSMEIHFIPLGPIRTCFILRIHNAIIILENNSSYEI